MPKISIVTTTYKHENFIRDTIESILSQSYTDWELLIGDDSPDDNSWKVIEEYTNKYPNKIRAWHHNPNKGIVGNTLFLLSQISDESKYIAFLEGDDIYTADNLAKKMEIFEKYPEVTLVYSDLSFIDKDNEVLLKSVFHYRSVKLYQNTAVPRDEFLLHKMGPISSWSTCMIQRRVFEEFGIDQIIDKRDAGDLHFYFQIATKYPIYGIDEPLTLYRRHSNNTSRPGGGITEHMERQMDYYYNNKIITKETYHKKLAWIYLTYAILDLEQLQKAQSFKHLKKSLTYSIFGDVLYKIGIIGLLCIPKFLLKRIMDLIIKRS